MSRKELPAPAGSGSDQTRAFSVLGGFRDKHPMGDSLARPMGLDFPSAASSAGGGQENTSRHQGATATSTTSSVLADLRHARQDHQQHTATRARDGEMQLAQIPPEPAHKLQDPTTQVTLQQELLSRQRNKGSLYAAKQRRYSRSQQDGSDEDTFDANTLIQKFSNSLTFSSKFQQSRSLGDSSNVDNATATPDTQVLHRYFDRRRSSPDVSALGQLRSASNLQLTSRIMPQPPAETTTTTTSASSAASISSKLLHKGMDKSASFSDLQSAAVVSANNPNTSGQLRQPMGQDSMDASSLAASKSSSSNPGGYGLLSRTRQFGMWLTKATDGEKVEVTKKDLNAFAPISF